MSLNATYFGSLRAKLILLPLDMPKLGQPSMNRYRMFLVLTSTPPLKHAPKTCQAWKVLYAKEPTPDQVMLNYERITLWSGTI